jgi:hypothetical protein
LCDKFLKNNKLIYTIILTTFISSNLLFFYKEYYPIRSSSISIENNRTLALAAYIKTNTPVNTPIVIYGYGWSSEVAFYSERKSLSLPEDKWYLEAIQNPSKFLKNPPSAYILCPVPGVNVLQGLIEEKYKVISNQKIYDCQVLIVNGWN